MADRAGVRKALALLDDSAFRQAVDAFHDGWRHASPQGKAARTAALQRLGQNLDSFRQRWGVVPVLDYALFDPVPSEPIQAVLAGSWGLVPVFPWTTESDAQRAFRAIRKRMPHQHAEALARRRQDRQAAWLLACGFPARDIAMEVYGRTRGLKAPRSLRRADALLAKYLRAGMGYRQAEVQARREAFAKEVPAAAQVRMAATRARKADAAGLAARLAPQPTEPLSAAVSALLRVRAQPPDPVNIKARVAAYVVAVEALRRAVLGQSHP